PASLPRLHVLGPEDDAARSRCPSRLRRLRGRARFRAAARRICAQSDRVGALLLRAAHAASRLVTGSVRFQGVAMSRAVLLAFAVISAAPAAHAFCGFFMGKADTELFNKSSQVALVR